MIQRIKEAFRIWLAITHARRVQDHIWGESNHTHHEHNMGDLIPMLKKRIDKIYAIRAVDNEHWRVELRKRLLQQAAISIALMESLDRGAITSMWGEKQR